MDPGLGTGGGGVDLDALPGPVGMFGTEGLGGLNVSGFGTGGIFDYGGAGFNTNGAALPSAEGYTYAIAIDFTSINSFLSGGGGSVGVALQHQDEAGWGLYTDATPDWVRSEGFTVDYKRIW